MYGASGKLGRGGGGRGTKRMLHSPLPPPPPLRPAGGGAAPRLPIGGSHSRHNNPAAAAAQSSPEETFSLHTSEPLAHAMIIRLAPDLVKEIKRAESQGGTVRIKFDSHTNNSSGNVIDVGGKDFRFTWSLELGDLCNIYEERRNGEDGNGLLVESGSAWRKLNVQRILDESTRDHVKMMSEEAERQAKSRKAIVLDPSNPSFKNQAKTMAAAQVDANPRRIPFKHKKDFTFKKRKVEPSQVAIAAPPKSVYKSGIFSMASAKSRPSVSPVPSPSEQPVASTSPFGFGNPSRGHTSFDGVAVSPVKNKEDANSEKDMNGRVVSAITHESADHKGNLGAAPLDLRNLLITLLQENSKGMSLKALEKAVSETIPNSGKKIETIIKTIANLQTPGRYFLKPEVEKESLKKSSPESGSSPERPHVQTPAEKVPTVEFGQQVQLSSKAEELNVMERAEPQQDSHDMFVSNSKIGNSSSSESESESESGSDSSDSGSDSGSQSRSRSKSRSPARSGSASSSDSESDGTSSSREESDVAVDIMTSDDDKDHKTQVPDPVSSSSPISWRGYDENKQDGLFPLSVLDSKVVEKSGETANEVEIDKVSPVDVKFTTYKDDEIEIAPNIEMGSYETNAKPLEERLTPLDRSKQSESERVARVGSSINENDEQTAKQSLDDERQATVKDNLNHEQSGNVERISKGKSKRVSELKQEKSENSKRSKLGPQAGHLGQSLWFGRSRDTVSSERPQLQSPDRPVQDLNKREHGLHITDNIDRDASATRSMHVLDKPFLLKDRAYKETQNEDGDGNEKFLTKNVRENAFGEKSLRSADSQYKKSGEQSGKPSKDVGPALQGHTSSGLRDSSKLDMDKRLLVNGKDSMLRRELSDLELGEFREPVPGEESQEFKRQFDRKNSFKLAENKMNTAGNSNFDMAKGRNMDKGVQESKKQSLPSSRSGIQDDHLDLTRSLPKPIPSQAQQFPRVDHVNLGALSELDKTVDMVGKAGKNDVRASQGMVSEGHASTFKKTPVGLLLDAKIPGPAVSSCTVKATRLQKSNPMVDLADKRREISWMETNMDGGKRKESSSDEENSFFSKYEKDEPEFKGPIRDESRYEEYTREYREKYDLYCSLNKILENDTNQFWNLAGELELVKGRDNEGYNSILAQVSAAYGKCGLRHKRMRKLFYVLHEELVHLKQRMIDYAASLTRG